MTEKKDVLLAVLKNKRDLGILKKHLWYRIPLSKRPRREIEYIAFYQPLAFAKNGSCIRYYARIESTSVVKRIELLPDELSHPNANKNYLKITFKKLNMLRQKITNRNRMRIAFGFTSLNKLLKAREVIELFGVPPIEKILAKVLKKENIRAIRQCIVKTPARKKYVLDFAIFGKNRPLNIECDGEKSHSLRSQRLKDIKRDRDLKKMGWQVLRLKDKEIIGETSGYIKKITEYLT